MPAETPQEDPRLTVGTRIIFGMGDFTVNTVLSSLSLVFTFHFLVEVAGLRPALAGLVPVVGRIIDAITDPLMGRISDHTSWRSGRRRPYFLLGALPFGCFFALLWVEPGIDNQIGLFSYYTAIYVLLSIAMTVVSVPYLALLPEMAATYDGRTSLNAYRNAGSIVGVFAAVSLRPVANALGGGPAGYASAGLCFGVLVAVPWLAVFARTFERPEFQQRSTAIPLYEGFATLARNRTYRQLMGLYLSSRVSMDLVGAMLLPYFTYWIGRSGDFEPMMFLFLTSVLLSLPVWLRISYRVEKATIFQIGAAWWMVGNLSLFFVQPEWPRAVALGFALLIGVGYAVADLMPWAMIGEVVDEDDAVTGERREGIYNGSFTFLRKLGGMIAVAGAGLVLDFAGVQGGGEVSEGGRTAVRWLTAVGPAAFLAIAVVFARNYPLDRKRHAEVLAQLAERGR